MSTQPATGPPLTERLLLDEMFGPALALALREQDFDVVAVAGHPVLASADDPDIAAWAKTENRRVVTENVRDFAPMAGTGEPALRLLFTSARRFPRSRRNPAPLIDALARWLSEPGSRPDVEWLR